MNKSVNSFGEFNVVICVRFSKCFNGSIHGHTDHDTELLNLLHIRNS